MCLWLLLPLALVASLSRAREAADWSPLIEKVMLTFAVIVSTLLAVNSACTASENLIYNGDFELESDKSPPPGWAMWGAGKYKIPANYTRDTTHPNSGKACFRIFHPKDTDGYIVTDPQYAIRPREGMMYRIRFFARTDKPGFSLFGIIAYESVRPFVDAPSPGAFPIPLDQNWREFSFEIHEGWDFFAHRSRYLLLMFKATTNPKEEKTIWVDDVEVLEMPSTRIGRLVDETRLLIEPLPHRLSPGEELKVIVDAGKRLRPTTKEAGGISFHRVAGWTGQPYDRNGNYTLPPSLEDAIRDLRLPMTRFYAVGDEPFGLEGAIDRIAEICRRTDIPQEWTVLELEEQSAVRKLSPEVWAQAVRYAKQKGYRFRFFEIANEPYISLWSSEKGKAFPKPEDYIAHVKAVSQAIKQENPEAKVGVAVYLGNLQWGNRVLKETAGNYNFVVAHHYCFANAYRLPFEELVLTENYRILETILRWNALISLYNPGRDVYQLDTEWGMHSGGLQGERADYVDRNANIIGTLHRAVRLIYYAREGFLKGASSWQMLSLTPGQGFGILFSDAPKQRSMLYWLYWHFNRLIGDWVLEIEGTAPYYKPVNERDAALAGPMTPFLATLSRDGKTLTIMIVNGSWTKFVPFSITLRNFSAEKVNGFILSHDDIDGKPLLQHKDDFVREFPMTIEGSVLEGKLPPHCVVFLNIASRR